MTKPTPLTFEHDSELVALNLQFLNPELPVAADLLARLRNSDRDQSPSLTWAGSGAAAASRSWRHWSGHWRAPAGASGHWSDSGRRGH